MYVNHFFKFSHMECYAREKNIGLKFKKYKCKLKNVNVIEKDFFKLKINFCKNIHCSRHISNLFNFSHFIIKNKIRFVFQFLNFH